MCCHMSTRAHGASLPPVAASDLEASALVISGITQPFEGAGLRVLYLSERVCCQLVGTDAPQVPMDPLEFMLASPSMSNAEYRL